MTTTDPPERHGQDPHPSAPSVAVGTRWARRWTIFGALAVAACIGVLGAALVRIPYYAISPGSIRATEPLIDLGEGEPDADAGEISFATVALDGRLSLLQALAGWLDSTVEVVDEDLILHGQSPQDSRAANQVLMEGSKDVAVQVALDWLGLSRPVGAEVGQVLRGSPADGVLELGDVVVAMNGTDVSNARALVEQVRLVRPGERVVLRVVAASGRNGERDERETLEAAAREVEVVLGVSDVDPARGLLGVSVRDALFVSYDGHVAIDSGEVGGPSAGLAFALGVIDLLTGGDLTGGTKVAATGTIGADGRVGPIGGIEQKAVAARRAGITLFLVPDSQSAAELLSARELAEGVELVAVGTLEQALAALAAHGGDEVAMAGRAN